MRTQEGSVPALATTETFGANDRELHTQRDKIEKVFAPSGGEAGQ